MKPRVRRLAVPVFFILILFLVSALKLLPDELFSHRKDYLIEYTVSCLIILLWTLSSAPKLHHPQVRRFHMWIIICFILMLFFHTMKVVVFPGVYPWEHVCWYLYYPVTLGVALLSWFMALCVGKSESEGINKKAYLMLIPYALLVIGILTNDLHEQAFILGEKGVAVSVSGHYQVNWLFFVAQAWLLCSAVACVARLARICNRQGLQIYLWPFIAITLSGILYTVLFILNRTTDRNIMIIEPHIMSFTVAMGLWETAIRTGLFPTNQQYDKFFEALSVPMEIRNTAGEVCFASAGVGQKTCEDRQIQERSIKIPGGSFHWQEDITEITGVMKQLDAAVLEKQQTTEQLQDKARVRKEIFRKQSRIELYEKALRHVRHQIEDVRKTIRGCEGLSERRAQDALARASVLAAYIKRRSNLALIASGKNELPAQELHFCVRETHEALALVPVSTVYLPVVDPECKLSPDVIARIYDLFEAEIEAVLSTLELARIELTATEEQVELVLTMSGTGFTDRQVRWVR